MKYRFQFTTLLLPSAFAVSEAQTTSWQWLNPLPQGNPLFAVSFVDENIGTAVGDNGTILRTTNGGVTWALQSSGTKSLLFGVCFTDANTGTAVGGSVTLQGQSAVILRTSDGGATWTSQASGTTHFLTGVFFTDVMTGTVVGESGTILRTINGGKTWVDQSIPSQPYLFGVHFTDANHGTAVGDRLAILHTTDGGAHWTDQSLPDPWPEIKFLTSVAFTDSNTGTVVGGGGNSTPGSYSIILHTTNGGMNWMPSTSSAKILHSISFADAQTGTAAGDAGTILHTTDAGVTWTSEPSGTRKNLRGVSFPSSTTGIAVGEGGTILRATDGGTSWVSQLDGPTDVLTGVSFFGAKRGSAVGFDFDPLTDKWRWKIHRTTDGGATWTSQLSDLQDALNAVILTDDNTGFIVGGGYDSVYNGHATLLRTTDGGSTWFNQPVAVPNPLYGVFFLDANRGYAVGGRTILRTTNGGSTWSTDSITGTGGDIKAIAFADSNRGIAVGDSLNSNSMGEGIIIGTTDGGATWKSQVSGGMSGFHGVAFADSHTAAAVGEYGGILVTTDGGSTWQGHGEFMLGNLLSVSFPDARTGIAVGELGTILRTTNGGTDWVRSNSPTSNDLFSLSTPRSGSGWIAVAVGRDGTIICAASSPLNPKSWVGTVDSLWDTPDNWDPVGIPTPKDSVIIPPTTVKPVIMRRQQQITLASLTVLSGGMLTLTDSLARFVVKGDVTIYGTLEVRPAAATIIVVGGNWIVQPGGSLLRSQAHIDGGFLPARSTVRFNGSGTCERNFFNLVFDTIAVAQSRGNVTVENQCAVLGRLTLRPADTLVIQSSEPQALNGEGTVERGTIKRSFQSSATVWHRFESLSTGVRFDTSGIHPLSVSMTTYPDTNPADFGGTWSIVTSSIDTLTNTIVADSVTRFSKWAIGIPRLSALEGFKSMSDTVPIVRRVYELNQEGGSNFRANLRLHYDESEVPPGVDESSLELLRSDISAGVAPPQGDLPGEFALYQNFPNPFNPSTEFRFRVPEFTRVALRVYDVLGRVVATVFEGDRAPGEYTVPWEARGMASGIYFYRMQAGKFFDSKKLMLLR